MYTVNRETTRVLHSDSIDADSPTEYREFNDMRTAMESPRYDKVATEIVPVDGEMSDADRVADELSRRLQGYSVQLFVKSTGGKLYVLVVGRQEDADISSAKDVVHGFKYDNYFEDSSPPNYYEGRKIQERDFA